MIKYKQTFEGVLLKSCSEKFLKIRKKILGRSFFLLIQLDPVDIQLHLKRDYSTRSFCEFYEIRKSIFFAEHHWTTASDYSSISRSEGEIDKRNCKL